MTAFSAMQASRLSGVAFNTLHNWERKGFVLPSVALTTGRRRAFSFRDVVALRVAAELREHGVEVPVARRVVVYLQAHEGISASIPLPPTLLALVGGEVLVVDPSTPPPFAVLQGRGKAPCTFVPLNDIVSELQNAACPPRRAPKGTKNENRPVRHAADRARAA